MESDDVPPEPEGLEALKSSCFIPAKQTGIATLIVQFIILLVSGMTVLFFFYHVGGYEYMGWNENSTILEPVHRPSKQIGTANLDATGTEAPVQRYVHKRQVDAFTTIQEVESLLNDTEVFVSQWNETDFVSTTTEDSLDLFSNDTEEIVIPDVFIPIDFMNTTLDMLEMIRISTLAYITLAILWLLSLITLLLSIRFEIIDLVVVNAVCLTASVFYLLIHAAFMFLLLYYLRDLHFRSLLIIIGSVVILGCSVLLGGLCLYLLIGWYKYIVYMNDSEKCFCVALCVSVVKGEPEQPSRAQEYAMRDAGRNDITYSEPPVNNFSNF